MSKFVTISYYPDFLKGNDYSCYGDGDIDKPFTKTLNVDSIMSIADKPRILNTFKSYDLRNSDICSPKTVYLLETNVGVGRGINGIDFRSYFITDESYRKLIAALEPGQCA